MGSTPDFISDGQRKAISYKYTVVYSRAEKIAVYGGSNQVFLSGNTDNVWYYSSPEDCQSYRDDNYGFDILYPAKG